MHWSDVEDIVEELEEMYSEEDIPENNLIELKEMVFSLHKFEDKEIEVDNSVLENILEEWLSFRNDSDSFNR